MNCELKYRDILIGFLREDSITFNQPIYSLRDLQSNDNNRFKKVKIMTGDVGAIRISIFEGIQ